MHKYAREMISMGKNGNDDKNKNNQEKGNTKEKIKNRHKHSGDKYGK